MSGMLAPEKKEEIIGLVEIRVDSWNGFVFVNPSPSGPGLLEYLEVMPEHFRNFDLTKWYVHAHVQKRLPANWKLACEAFMEAYHTPFVHPEIDTSNTHDYPMVADGLVLYAWDRPLRPTTEAGRVMAELLPGEPGWEVLGRAPTAVPYDVGSYLTIWPNLMLNVFPDACLAMWVAPVAPNRTVVHRRLFAHPSASAEAVAAQLEAHRLVHQQDVDMCAAVQRTHDAGIDADGVLATVEERGVFFVHQHVRSVLEL